MELVCNSCNMIYKTINGLSKHNKKYHSDPDRVNYREELNSANRRAGTYGNKDGKDMSHTKNGKLVKESKSTNRARNGKGNNKRFK